MPFMSSLLAAQQRAGIAPSVLAPHGPGLPRRASLHGVDVRRFRYAPERAEVLAYRGGLVNSARTARGAMVLPAFLAALVASAVTSARRGGVQLLHAHWWMPAGVAAVIAGRRAGVPVVVTCHGSDAVLAQRQPWSRVARGVLSRADAVTAASDYLSGQLQALSGRDVIVTPMPVELDDRPVTPAPSVTDGLRLLCAGRLSPEKGFDVAITAVQRLQSEGVRVTLDIAGEGPEETLLSRLVARGEGVRLMGPLSRSELTQAIDASHCVVVPSRHEGLGLVALESLARRRPVIASAVGGLPEAVRPGDGLLVPAGDPAVLAQAIRQLPLPEPGGAALEGHLPETVGQAHAELYRRVLTDYRGRR